MTLGNGTFDPLRRSALDHGKPLVMFAQTGSAVLPRFLGAGVAAVCAEPYPFFWLDGGPGTVHRYRSADSGPGATVHRFRASDGEPGATVHRSRTSDGGTS